MSKKITILFFILFGFMMNPSESYACGQSHDHSTKDYTEKKSVDSEKKDCCTKESRKKDKKGCDGNCGDTTCFCPTYLLNFTIPSFYPLFSFIHTDNTRNYFYKDTYFLSVFLSIWLPPKIS